jgi:phosphocarrier protein
MKEFTFVVTDKNGLHARPAGTVASCAKKYKSDIKIYNDEKEANAK